MAQRSETTSFVPLPRRGSGGRSPPKRGPVSKGKASVFVFRTMAELEPYVARWEELARRALEPNVFLEPWMFLAGLRAFGAARELELVVVERRDGSMIGFFPFTRERQYRGVPVTALASWRHDFHFLSTPLVDAERGRECMEALFEWLERDSNATLVELAEVSGDGPFQHLLIDVLCARKEPFEPILRQTRGLYLLGSDGDAYLGSIMDSEARRRLRSKERHLGERGRLEYTELGAGGDIRAWTAEFLALEASGWKGTRGTAMAAEPSRRRYFEEVLVGAFTRRQLEILALRLDGRAVAMKCNFHAGDGAFVFKIAYDEALGKYSPGMLLEVENIRRMHGRPGLRWMDSCAHPDSRIFGAACDRRRTIETVIIAPRGEPGRLLVSLFPLARWASRQVRSLRDRIVALRSSDPAPPSTNPSRDARR